MTNPQEQEMPIYRFADLTSGDDFMVREHLEDLRPLVPNSHRFVGLVFNHLVDGKGSPDTKHPDPQYERLYRPLRPMREPEPFKPLNVVARQTLGVEPYSGGTGVEKRTRNHLCLGYAVQVSSVIEYSQELAAQDPTKLTHTQYQAINVGQLLLAQLKF